jgi:hypothetical protein
MKSVEVFRDFDYQAHPRRTIRFHAGVTYTRVLEAAAKAIERAGAGRVVGQADAAGSIIDASHAFRPGIWRVKP